MSKIANNVKDECYKCNGCIYFSENEEFCYEEELSATAKEVCKSPILKQYIFTLKSAYDRYLDNMYKSITQIDKNYWRGMSDSILALFNDLGFNYLL